MKNINKETLKSSLICGILGCICYGTGDWLMIYGDPTSTSKLKFLTKGTANIPQWRYSLSLFLSFPGIILYGIALFSIENFIFEEKNKKIYHYLNIFGLTPWIALHLFFIMILSLFSWMNKNGYNSQAIPVCEGLFSQLSWFVLLSEIMMVPVFIYWFYLQIKGKTIFPKRFAFTNVILIYFILKIIYKLMPISARSIGFGCGLMSESMVIWFGFMLNFTRKKIMQI